MVHYPIPILFFIYIIPSAYPPIPLYGLIKLHQSDSLTEKNLL